MLTKIIILSSIMGAAQVSVLCGSLALSIWIGCYSGHAFLETVLLFIPVALVALVGVNCVAVFVAIPLRFMFQRRISLFKIVLLSTIAGALIYSTFDLVSTSLWYINNVEDFKVSSLKVWESLKFFSLIGSIYGFFFGVFYYVFETTSLADHGEYRTDGFE